MFKSMFVLFQALSISFRCMELALKKRSQDEDEEWEERKEMKNKKHMLLLMHALSLSLYIENNAAQIKLFNNLCNKVI